MAIMIQEGYSQQLFQVLIIIDPVLAFLPFGHTELIPLFPDSEGMGFDAAKILNIPDSKMIHKPTTKVLFIPGNTGAGFSKILNIKILIRKYLRYFCQS